MAGRPLRRLRNRMSSPQLDLLPMTAAGGSGGRGGSGAAVAAGGGKRPGNFARRVLARTGVPLDQIEAGRASEVVAMHILLHDPESHTFVGYIGYPEYTDENGNEYWASDALRKVTLKANPRKNSGSVGGSLPEPYATLLSRARKAAASARRHADSVPGIRADHPAEKYARLAEEDLSDIEALFPEYARNERLSACVSMVEGTEHFARMARKYALRKETPTANPRPSPRDYTKEYLSAKGMKRRNPEFSVFHADHGIAEGQMDYIKSKLVEKAPQGFFIQQVNLPKRLGTVRNAMYGPAAGDSPVPESAVEYRPRGDRPWSDRVVRWPTRPTNYVQVIGIRDGDAFKLFTVYGGPLAPMNPADPGISTDKERAKSKRFWAKHALSLDQWKSNPRGMR